MKRNDEKMIIEGLLKKIKKTMEKELEFLLENLEEMKRDYKYKKIEDISKRFSNEVIFRAWKNHELNYLYRQEKVTDGKGLFQK